MFINLHSLVKAPVVGSPGDFECSFIVQFENFDLKSEKVELNGFRPFRASRISFWRMEFRRRFDRLNVINK